MVIFPFGIVPDLEDHGTQAPAAPPDRAELLGVLVLLVNQISLIENLLSLFEADAVLPLNLQVLA